MNDVKYETYLIYSRYLTTSKLPKFRLKWLLLDRAVPHMCAMPISL